jgi:hypothetical protein
MTMKSKFGTNAVRVVVVVLLTGGVLSAVLHAQRGGQAPAAPAARPAVRDGRHRSSQCDWTSMAISG